MGTTTKDPTGPYSVNENVDTECFTKCPFVLFPVSRTGTERKKQTDSP